MKVPITYSDHKPESVQVIQHNLKAGYILALVVFLAWLIGSIAILKAIIG